MVDKKGAKPQELVVFAVTNETECSECAGEIFPGDFLRKEGEKGLCLTCADLDHLVYLPRGDAALTRRARKYSTLSAAVLKWSRRRKQYERQGLLVNEEGLEKAEIECALDADRRAVRQKKAREQEQIKDSEYVKSFAAEIRRMFPQCPETITGTIAHHACAKYSGRVGRTAAAKQFAPETVEAAVRAHVRHTCTDYDELLLQGMSRREAREDIWEKVDEVMSRWKTQNPRVPG